MTNKIQEDLNTTYSNVSLTIAIYTIVLGLMPLIWGPSADYFGRRRPALVSMVIYIISTIICIFVPNIALLIVFRTTQAIGTKNIFSCVYRKAFHLCFSLVLLYL